VLRVERVAACLPPDVQVLIASTHVEAMEAEDVQKEIADQVGDAELPDPLEVEEEEAAADEQAGEEEAKEVAAAGDSSGMIGQLPTENEVANSTSGKDYATIKKLAWDKVRCEDKKNGPLTWKVIESIDNNNVIPEHDILQYGLKNFSCGNYRKSEIIAKIFLCLTFRDWREKVEKLNNAVVSRKPNAGFSLTRNFLPVLQ
jgi:hypothetical protein